MAATALAKLRRPCWPDGRFVRRGIDRVATALWLGAVAARVSVVPLAIFGSLAKMLFAVAIDQLLSLAANLRLHSVTKRREAVGEIDRPAPNRLRQWWNRDCEKAAARAESKADHLAKRESETEDDFKAWDYRRRAEPKREQAAIIRQYVDDNRSIVEVGPDRRDIESKTSL